MKGDFASATDPPDLGNWLDSTNLIIGVHHRDQNGLIGNSPCHVIGIDPAILIDWYVARFEAKAIQVLTGMQHGMMLN